MFYLHFDENSGDILSILNPERHELLVPNIPISAQKRDMIVNNPSAFKVIERKVVNIGSQIVDAEREELERQHKKEQMDSKICGYVDEDKICWMSDDAALMELNLALGLCAVDPEFKPKIHCMENGIRKLMQVDKNKLVKIASAIHNLRADADNNYFERMYELKNINRNFIVAK